MFIYKEQNNKQRLKKTFFDLYTVYIQKGKDGFHRSVSIFRIILC